MLISKFSITFNYWLVYGLSVLTCWGVLVTLFNFVGTIKLNFHYWLIIIYILHRLLNYTFELNACLIFKIFLNAADAKWPVSLPLVKILRQWSLWTGDDRRKRERKKRQKRAYILGFWAKRFRQPRSPKTPPPAPYTGHASPVGVRGGSGGRRGSGRLGAQDTLPRSILCLLSPSHIIPVVPTNEYLFSSEAAYYTTRVQCERERYDSTCVTQQNVDRTLRKSVLRAG